MKYNNWTLGQVEAVFNKLGGDEGVRRFLADELVVKPVQPELKVFKTIKLGTGLKTADGFRKAVKDKGMRIGDYANDILGKPAFTVAKGETEVDLVVISVAELGFKDGAKREDIYVRAKELGLELCPSEVGPQLRMQYVDQPKDEWLVIGMEPIADSDGDLKLFYVKHGDDDLWLSSHYHNPHYFWSGSYRFVFVLPRK
jgi:hypothetical protein